MDYDDDGRQGLQEDDLLDDAEIDTLIRDIITQTIGDSLFEHANVTSWTTEIVEGCLKRLAALRKPFKYVVTCNLAQKVQCTGNLVFTLKQKLCRCDPSVRICSLSSVDLGASRWELASTAHAQRDGMTGQMGR